MKKIYSLSDLAKILEKKRDSGNKIVMCHGVFDLIHLGHIEHFKKAKQYGDLLVVTTTSDEFINKGPGKPFFSAELRKRVLSNIECIDFVTEIDDTTAIKGIKKMIQNKQAIYDLRVDKTINKIGSGEKLEKYNIENLPEVIKLNLGKYKEWLD